MVTAFGEQQAVEMFGGIEEAANSALAHINLVTAYLSLLASDHQAAIASLESIQNDLNSIKVTASEAPNWVSATVNSDGRVCFPA